MPVIWRREDQPNLFSVSLIGWTSRQSPWSRQRGIYSYQQNTPFYVFKKNTSIFINSCILLFLLLVREESASAAPPSMSFHFCYFYSKRTAPPDSVPQLDSSFSFFFLNIVSLIQIANSPVRKLPTQRRRLSSCV